ncbi:MAG: LuxR C-terminal-related transcriptional regulator [Acidobacteriota bacterium]
MTPSETLDRISRGGQAVFAIDSTDRIILWNGKCEKILGRKSRDVLGKKCYEVLAGRDVHGNVYCYRNCPVAFQALEKPSDPVQKFSLSVELGKSGPKWFEISLFAVPSYHPALSTVVHVVRESRKKPSALERDLTVEAKAKLSPVAEPLWPITARSGPLAELTAREREVLRGLSEGLSTSALAKRLSIAPVTVRNHVQNILQKLDVHTKLAAVALAYHHGLIDEPKPGA